MQASFPYSEKILLQLYRWEEFSEKLLEECKERNASVPYPLDEVWWKLREETTQLLDEDRR